MKRLLIQIAFVVSLVIVLSLTASAASVVDANGNEYFPENNTFYLPSIINPSSVQIKADSGISQYQLTESAGIYKKEIDGAEYTFYFANNLPSIYVTSSLTRDELMGDEKKDINAKATITDKDNNIEYADTDSTVSEFKVRGNTTRDYRKKPFQLKLSSKTGLFGMGEARTWVLLANYLDQSQIRNSVMYKIGEIFGMDTCDFRSVDLYVNGEYMGIYLLCEKVQIQENRIDIFDLEEEMELLAQPEYKSTFKISWGKLINETIITEYQFVENMVDPEDITGGYLVELDSNYYKSERAYFKTSNGNAYVIKSPENASEAQVEYIARIFAEMEEAIYSKTGKNSLGKHYTEYADIESLAYAYIMQELGRNWDSGSSSMYFYKDRDNNGEFSKIVKGPLWDCDNTLGNMLKNDANNQNTFFAKYRNFWRGLTQHSDFNYEVAKAFYNHKGELLDMASQGGYIDKLVDELGTSIVMEQSKWGSNNYESWPMYSEYLYPNVHYDDWQSSQTFQFIDTYSDGVDSSDTTVIGYLKTCLRDRTIFLSSSWKYTPEIDSDSDVAIDTETDISTDKDTETDAVTDTVTDIPSDSDSDIVPPNDDKRDIKPMITVLVIMVSVITFAGIIFLIIKMKK